MVSALAETKQVQEILGEYHEDTHIMLETDSSTAKANAERPGCGRMKHIKKKYRYLQDAITNQEVWLHKTQCCRWFDKDSESASTEKHVHHTENRDVGNCMQTCVHQDDRGQKYPERADGNKSRRRQPLASIQVLDTRTS